MSLFVKICGINHAGAASAAAEAGADAVGFVFAPSPRMVSPQTAATLAAELPPEVLKVAVFRRPARSELEEVLEVFQPDLVQADQGTPRLPGVEFLPVYREESRVRPAPGTRFLYEGRSSGVGRMVDLATAASVGARGRMVLAGGLHPGNVAAVVARVGPYGVDVSSGVETSPGVKHPALIAEFVAAARTGLRR